MFKIPVLPTLPNRKGQGRHWAVEAKYRKQWHTLVYWSVRGHEARPEAPFERARVVLTRHSKREPDPDNLAASWKPVLDGLVQARVIRDDSPAHIELVSRWEKIADKGPGFIVVEVEGL